MEWAVIRKRDALRIGIPATLGDARGARVRPDKACSSNSEIGTVSICVLAVEDAEQGHGDDLQVEGEAPVAQIVEIVLDALGD
jgi:hypothetical protein